MRTVTVYHGTSGERMASILREGLTSPSMRYHSAKWYMVAEDFASAAFHASDSDPVVVELRLPSRRRTGRLQWPGYPYLWMPNDIAWGPRGGEKRPTRWYALREPIPPRYIRRVHVLTPEEWSDYHVM